MEKLARPYWKNREHTITCPPFEIFEEYTALGVVDVCYLVSLLARRRAVAVVSLVLIVLGRLELRLRGPGRAGLEVSRVRSRGRPVVLLELESVLGGELGLLLQPPVILLLVLGVLARLHWRLGRTSSGASVLLGGTSWSSIASPWVSSLRENR